MTEQRVSFFGVCTMHVGVAQGCQIHVYGLILGLILQVVSPSKMAGIFIEFDFALYCPVNDVFAALRN